MSVEHSSDLWGLLESPPAGCEAVADLWNWSMNFDAGQGPASLFLDLIGHSADEYGCNLYASSEAGYPGLSYMELDKLGRSLCEYADDPHGGVRVRRRAAHG